MEHLLFWSFKLVSAMSLLLRKADTSVLALLTQGLWLSVSLSYHWSECCSVWRIGRNSPLNFSQILVSSLVLSFCKCILKMYLKIHFFTYQHDNMSFSAFLLNFRGFWQLAMQKTGQKMEKNGIVWQRISLNVLLMQMCGFQCDIFEEALTILWTRLIFSVSL